MKAQDTPCTRRELLKTVCSGLAEAGGSLISEYTDPLCSVLSAEAAAAAARQPGIKPGNKTTAKLVRPPGAAAEARFTELCARCGACGRACPSWVIRKAGPESGAGLEGTPMLCPEENPCLFCGGLPCAAACGTGALVPPQPGSRARIGLAVVNAARCYSALGQPCELCAAKCPVNPRGISVSTRKSAAADPEACDGCGRCAQACPAAAITIEASR